MSTDWDGGDQPRQLSDPVARQQRETMLGAAHMVQLTEYTAKLRSQQLGEVPNFDPLDGGVDAQVLFLFEKPGPMTAQTGKRPGSGFISRNNDDPTATAIFHFMRDAGLPRKLTVLWNVIPWWNGTRKVSSGELRAGVEALEELVSLLPKSKAVVLVGTRAASAAPLLRVIGRHILTSCHPSPIVRATMRERWDAIPAEWAKVLPYCD